MAADMAVILHTQPGEALNLEYEDFLTWHEMAKERAKK